MFLLRVYHARENTDVTYLLHASYSRNSYLNHRLGPILHLIWPVNAAGLPADRISEVGRVKIEAWTKLARAMLNLQVPVHNFYGMHT